VIGEGGKVRRLFVRTLVIGGATLVALRLIRTSESARRAVGRAAHDAVRRARYLRGVADGAAYRLRGQHPDPTVSDDILTQRVRSTLGRLEKVRDLPRVHVMVEDRLVLLHGEVPSADDLFAVEDQVLDTPGVRAVESYLHVGLARGTTRPSAGRAAHADQPSDARRVLLQAARDGGAPEDEAVAAARAVLSTFMDRIPEDEREQLLAHLPRDARELATPPRRHGEPARLRTVGELLESVGARGDIDAERTDPITRAVLRRLRQLVPEETADVAAVLPHDLRALWDQVAT
jgi:hypothetical protein